MELFEALHMRRSIRKYEDLLLAAHGMGLGPFQPGASKFTFL